MDRVISPPILQNPLLANLGKKVTSLHRYGGCLLKVYTSAKQVCWLLTLLTRAAPLPLSCSDRLQ